MGVLVESELVTKSVDHSPLFTETSSDCLYLLDIRCQVNGKLVTALAACAATAEKDVKAMTKLYLHECIAINQFVARLCSSDMFRSLSSFDTSNPAIRRHLSLLLQIICMEYIEVFHTLIGSPSGEKSLTMKEQVDSAIAFAATAAMFDLYSRRKVMNNLYYIIGFVGGQMEKHVKRMARGSGKQACMLQLHK